MAHRRPEESGCLNNYSGCDLEMFKIELLRPLSGWNIEEASSLRTLVFTNSNMRLYTSEGCNPHLYLRQNFKYDK